ncbi:MAG: molybdate ABC transporter substrate-binding protein [Ornithinimicrobium sp.]|uniref:molybdate ABC transporter substrate-binding protein n=1 Tax=Ornithinimicrobium sp. TaxID=1977084 RepID=UPI0017DDFE68|nr:molybdate ABC transporter substrate-binding protein [Actinomycetota bacterium]
MSAACPSGPWLAATLLVGMLACAGCATPSDDTRTVTVLAAASLTDVMTEVEEQVEETEPDLDLQLSYAGSSTIVQQVNEGADADVVLLAGGSSLSALSPDLPAGDPVVFASNTLTVVVPQSNPAGVTGLDDLDAPGLRLVLCAEQVPCGAAAATMFERAGIAPSVVSYEPDVRATLAKVASREADAGVVYVTDVDPTAGVTAIPVPDDLNVVNRYPAVALGDAPAGPAFVRSLRSDEVQALLTRAGFGAP